MHPSRNNLGVSHLGAYRLFVAAVFGQLNDRVTRKFNEERGMLMALPARRSSDYEEVNARVTKYCTMTVKKLLYTASSRLGASVEGQDLRAAAGVLAGNVCVLDLERGQPDPISERGSADGVEGPRHRVGRR